MSDAASTDYYDLASPETIELQKNIWRIVSPEPASNVYLIKDTLKTVLIDTGIYQSFDHIRGELAKLDLRPEDVDLVINTHEHYDHIGGNPYFSKTALIAASRNAASKIRSEDEYVTHMKVNSQQSGEVHLSLEGGMQLITGEYRFKILHTPGHTSGSICIYEPFQRFIFTGDTLVAGQYLTPMLESGSAGDFLDSIENLMSLKIDEAYPGHGPESRDPAPDLAWAHGAAREKLAAFQQAQTAGQKPRIRASG
jgi:hydroxyacylglutathione hydrolase